MFGRRKEVRRDHCLNCGNRLAGPYCHVCGQKDDDFRRPFMSLGNEFFADNFAWDARIPRSILPFLFLPGELTRAYIDGKRGTYVTPLRLYLVVSLVFFLLLVGSNIAIMQVEYTEGFDLEQDMPEVAAALGDVDEEHLRGGPSFTLRMFAPVDEAAASRAVQIPSDLREIDEDIEIQADGDVTEEEVLGWIARFATGVNIALANPMIFNEILNERLPTVLIVLVPFFALLLGLVYVRRKFYLIDHLVFAIYYHAFIFSILVLSLLKAIYLPGIAATAGLGWWIVGATALYLFVGMKRVYGQGWIKTFAKFWLVFWTYFVVLSLAVMATSLLGVWDLPRDYNRLPQIQPATAAEEQAGEEGDPAEGSAAEDPDLDAAVDQALRDVDPEMRQSLEPTVRRAMEMKAEKAREEDAGDGGSDTSPQ